MGLFDSLANFVFGDSDAGVQAGNLEAQANREATEELRRQFGITQENISPFLQAGVGAIPQVQEGTTAGGLDERLSRIFGTDIFKSLLGERTRAVQGQLGATGQSRSGLGLLEAARVPTDLGLLLEQLLTGRSSNLVAGGQNAAIGLSSLGAQSSGNIANLISGAGQARGAGLITDAQSQAARTGQLINTALTGASIAFPKGFSDPRLKENIKKIGTIKGLSLYSWDWIPAVKGTIVDTFLATGFMSGEVKEKFPKLVSEFGGFEVINYAALLDELEVA